MTPQAILRTLWARGICLRLTPDGANLSATGGHLTADERALILAHKPELAASLVVARERCAALIAAAMRACETHGDGDQAREQMREDCLATPVHLQEDLRQHFVSVYGGKQP